MQDIQMDNVSEAELQQVEGGSWLAIAGGVLLGVALAATGVGAVAGIVAGTVYAVECQMVGA